MVTVIKFNENTSVIKSMKRLSIFLILLGLVGCNYPSKEQAEIACDEWKEKGVTQDWIKPYSEDERLTIIHSRATGIMQERYKMKFGRHPDWDDGGPRPEDYDIAKERFKEPQGSVSSRYCRLEKDTAQYLGYENNLIKNSEWVKDEEEGDYKIVKQFRY